MLDVNYKRQLLRRGFSEEQIREVLVKAGWVTSDVEEAFRFIKLKNKTSALICGDDLTTTNLERLQKAKGCINSVIIKPNQIGSLLKTREAVMFGKKNDITPIISHRSGETMDATIRHLAVAWGIPIIKCGIYGKERQAKLKEILKIEKEKL